MKYIGPFFRINTLTSDEIKYQLFHLSKESIKHIELQSRCGILISNKVLRKYLSTNDINIMKDFSPVICIYKKAHPLILKSGKHPFCWDSETFKKESLPDSDALLTFCLIELSKYYDFFENVDDELFSLSRIYKALSRIQLEFYAKSMRNTEGLFIEKKNSGDNYVDSISLTDKSKTISFSYQAYMMCAYYDYYTASSDADKEMYKNFALEILNMLIDYRSSIYNESTDECCAICYALNIFYGLSKDEKSKMLLLDLCDELTDRLENKSSLLSSLSSSCFTVINLYKSYENTGIYKFKDKALNLSENLLSLYDRDTNIINLQVDKKDVKYTAIDLVLFMLTTLYYFKYDESNEDDFEHKKKLIPNMYKNLIINSGILTSFPEAPDLNSAERYKNFSYNANDLIEESKYKLSSIESPLSANMASIFVKNVSYSTKKCEFSHRKSSFDSSKNIFLFSMFIYLFENDFTSYICGNEKPLPKQKVSMNRKISKEYPLDNKIKENSQPSPKLAASLSPSVETIDKNSPHNKYEKNNAHQQPATVKLVVNEKSADINPQTLDKNKPSKKSSKK
ncbi:hypothetical protein [Inconstantimicrobium porci]|uniref:hypothetical protein n=1 Tax=Inconstantimicrobium porci TaxID=2652291 RepID=UPI00240A611E|nr:hypothetical protein [Inconstantimicrobium porci]MDD6771307.1 hypothetical protein [Inconstantimicrobium porci]